MAMSKRRANARANKAAVTRANNAVRASGRKSSRLGGSRDPERNRRRNGIVNPDGTARLASTGRMIKRGGVANPFGKAARRKAGGGGRGG